MLVYQDLIGLICLQVVGMKWELGKQPGAYRKDLELSLRATWPWKSKNEPGLEATPTATSASGPSGRLSAPALGFLHPCFPSAFPT